MICNRCKRNGEICCRLGWTYAASVLVMRWLYFWVRLRSALLWFQLILLSFFYCKLLRYAQFENAEAVYFRPRGWQRRKRNVTSFVLKPSSWPLCIRVSLGLHVNFEGATVLRDRLNVLAPFCVATRVCIVHSFFLKKERKVRLLPRDCILVASRILLRNWRFATAGVLDLVTCNNLISISPFMFFQVQGACILMLSFLFNINSPGSPSLYSRIVLVWVFFSRNQ